MDIFIVYIKVILIIFKKGKTERANECCTIFTFEMELTGLFSLSNHSIFGVGIPLDRQSSRAPIALVKSNLDGGSKLNVGPILSYDVVVNTRSN